jgi:hypothetical protein
MVCPKSTQLYFFPAASNGERVEKLSIVVEGLSCARAIFVVSQHRLMRLSLQHSEEV